MEKNWLEVYPWFKWGGNDNLPPFQVNQTFMPTELLLKEVGPTLLTWTMLFPMDRPARLVTKST